VIPRFITALLRGEPPTIYGDGHQSRDFIYVANVVQANLLACEREAAIRQVMNVACGERYSLLDLHRELCELIGWSSEPVMAPSRPGDVRDSLAALDTARQALGYRPEVGWHEGLRRTVERYKAVQQHEWDQFARQI
jgi:UDP-glucose 4-epimerase